MFRFIHAVPIGCFVVLATTTSAVAQTDPVKGIYAVARAGASVSSEQKFDIDDLPSQSTFTDKTKYKTGVTGEIGAGYDFGLFRLEQTIGYMGNDLNAKDTALDGFAAGGRTRTYTVSINGYIDIPLHSVVVPYVGGGIGASRVEADLTRVGTTTGSGSSYSGKDWGMTFHGDVGVGVHVTPKATVELGGRYTQTGSLKFQGQNLGSAATFQPKLHSLSALLGVRYVF
jgi:opacity protein-like surface antigen